MQPYRPSTVNQRIRVADSIDRTEDSRFPQTGQRIYQYPGLVLANRLRQEATHPSTAGNWCADSASTVQQAAGKSGLKLSEKCSTG